MGVQTLRPNGTVTNTLGPTYVGGSTQPHVILSDNTDATRMIIEEWGTLVLAMGTYTLAANERVKRWRFRLRADAVNKFADDTKLHLMDARSANNVIDRTINLRVPFSGPITSNTGWFDDGLKDASQQAYINAVRTMLRPEETTGQSATNAGLDLYELYLDLDVYEATDTPTISTPSGTITDNDTPAVNWSTNTNYGLIGGYTQEVYIFSEDVYSEPSFNPANSDGQETWKQVSTGDANHGGSTVIGTPLANGTYRVYVRVGKENVAGRTLWSGWAMQQFVIAVAPPSPPSVTASSDPTNGRNAIGVTPPALTHDSLEALRVEGSYDGGTTWFTIRGGYLTSGISASTAVTLYDYDAPRGVPASYRARVVESLFTSGTTLTSDWAQDGPVTLLNDGRPWLITVPPRGWLARDDVQYAGPIHISLMKGIKVARPQNMGTFHPLGSSKQVVVFDSAAQLPMSVSLDIEAFNDPGVHAALGYPGSFLIKLRDGTQRYWHAVDRSYSDEASLWNDDITATLWSLKLVEIDADIGEDG